MSLFARFPSQISQFRNGVDSARKVFFDRYCPPVYHYLIWKCGDENEAKSMTAVVFHKAWLHRTDMKNEDYLIGFLFVTANHDCLAKQQGGLQRWKREAGAAISAEQAYQILEDPDVLRARSLSEMKRALNSLPDQQRRVMHKLYIERKTVKTAAGELRIQPQTVRNHKTRAVGKMRQQLSGLEFLLASIGLLLSRYEQ